MLIVYLAFGAIWWVSSYLLNHLIINKNLSGYKVFVCKTLPVIIALVLGNALLNGIGNQNSNVFEILFLALFAIVFFELLISPAYLIYKVTRKLTKRGN